VVADALAGRKPLHERTETGERRDQIGLVEPADGGRHLRLVVARMQACGLLIGPLGGMLVALPLQEDAAEQHWAAPRVLDERLEPVLSREGRRSHEHV